MTIIELKSICCEGDQEKYILQPKIIDMLLFKMRELASLKSVAAQDVQLQQLNDLVHYLLTVKKIMEVVPNDSSLEVDSNTFEEKLFDFNSEDPTSKPVIVEMFEIADNMYTSYYSTINDEDVNMSGLFSSSIKDKVNVLMFGVIELISTSIAGLWSRLREEESKFEEETRQRYIQAMRSMVKRVLPKFESYGLDSGYMSVLVFDAVMSLAMAADEVPSEMSTPVIIIRKIRNIVEWAHTKEFATLLGGMSENSHISSAVSITLRALITVIKNSNKEDKEKMIEENSNQNTIQYILGNVEFRTTLTNRQAQHVQEQIIRAYATISLLFLSSENGENSTLTTLENIWKVIGVYSEYERLNLDEFCHSQQIISSIWSSNHAITLPKVFDSRIFYSCYDCLFNFTEAVELNTYQSLEIINKAFKFLSEQNQIEAEPIRQKMFDSLKANLEVLQNKTDDLVNFILHQWLRFPNTSAEI